MKRLVRTGFPQYHSISEDNIRKAGTMRYAELKPRLPAHLFSSSLNRSEQCQQQHAELFSSVQSPDDEFGADEIDDQDMVEAGARRFELLFLMADQTDDITAESRDFIDIDGFALRGSPEPTERGPKSGVSNGKELWSAEKLENGKWACNHRCKDKTA